MMKRYPRVERLIQKICRKFHWRYGGDWDEIMSEANWAYVRAVKQWNPERSKLGTWVQTKVQFHLLQLREDRCKRLAREKTILNNPCWVEPSMTRTLHDEGNKTERHELIPAPESFDIRAFLRLLSYDARCVVRQALSPKLSLIQSQYRRDHLAQLLVDLGWAIERIINTFQEIQEALA